MTWYFHVDLQVRGPSFPLKSATPILVAAFLKFFSAELFFFCTTDINTSLDVIMARYDAIFDQSERAYLYNH